MLFQYFDGTYSPIKNQYPSSVFTGCDYEWLFCWKLHWLTSSLVMNQYPSPSISPGLITLDVSETRQYILNRIMASLSAHVSNTELLVDISASFDISEFEWYIRISTYVELQHQILSCRLSWDAAWACVFRHPEHQLERASFAGTEACAPLPVKQIKFTNQDNRKESIL